MCEASEHYLWDLSDKLGSGATSEVFKAYNMTTGDTVAAKVSKVSSVSYNVHPIHRNDEKKKSDSRSTFDRETNFLKNIDHDNIVRFIGKEIVRSSDNSNAPPNREVLFIEYCNGGSVGDMLRLPSNRYGFQENVIIHISRDVINALKYLHGKNIIHRDIKPDNILQSIDISGKSIFKLTDLGVARQINPGEETSYSIQGTEEFIHPIVYDEVFPDIKINTDGKTIRTRVQFPFEVEMWSFGVTLYQCSTGQIPFQPYEGVRKDRHTMKQILRSIPPGSISGIQDTYNGEIQWSKILPKWCRLSSNLKTMLEKVLSRLFETNQDKLMKHEDFFHDIDKILNLIPVYYVNLKRFQLTCAYVEHDQPINKLLNYIRQENNDEINTNYYCLFQNIHYPISSSERISIKTFYDRLPFSPSCEKPLIIYTFSSLRFDQKCIPKVDIPELQSMKTIRDVFASTFDWSKNILGLFFYIKNQLTEYESIMKMGRCSITTIRGLLQSKILALVCSIREKIIEYQVFDRFEKILDIIESKDNSSSVIDEPVPVINNRFYHKSIIKSVSMDEKQSDLSKMKTSLRSSMNFYYQLTDYDKDLSTMTDIHFSDDMTVADNQQLVFNTSTLSKQINNYSLHIEQIDKYIKEAMDVSEPFQRDLTNNTPSSLQMTFHILRQKLLTELYDKYIHFVNESCYPLILEIFNEYKKLIKQQEVIHNAYKKIQFSYNYQCENCIPIDNLRQIINNELQKLGIVDASLLSDYLSSICSIHTHHIHQNQQLTNVKTNENHPDSIAPNEIRAAIQKTIKEAIKNSFILDDIMKQLRSHIRNNKPNQ